MKCDNIFCFLGHDDDSETSSRRGCCECLSGGQSRLCCGGRSCLSLPIPGFQQSNSDNSDVKSKDEDAADVVWTEELS